MTDLDNVIQSAQHEIDDDGSKRRPRTKPDHARRINYRPFLLIVSVVVVLFQWNTLQSWIFGVPEGTIQADIIALLKNSDEKVQGVYAATGEIPTVLPEEMPTWLLGYKKTLAGYKIDAEIDGVLVELERDGDSVTINRQ